MTKSVGDTPPSPPHIPALSPRLPFGLLVPAELCGVFPHPGLLSRPSHQFLELVRVCLPLCGFGLGFEMSQARESAVRTDAALRDPPSLDTLGRGRRGCWAAQSRHPSLPHVVHTRPPGSPVGSPCAEPLRPHGGNASRISLSPFQPPQGLSAAPAFPPRPCQWCGLGPPRAGLQWGPVTQGSVRQRQDVSPFTGPRGISLCYL